MCLLNSRGMSAVCTWGLRGAVFRLVFFCDLPPCCFVGHFPLHVPTLILRFFWNDRIASPTICHPSTYEPSIKNDDDDGECATGDSATGYDGNVNDDVRQQQQRWRRHDSATATARQAMSTMMMATGEDNNNDDCRPSPSSLLSLYPHSMNSYLSSMI